MRVGAVLAVIWLVIGILAAVQRGYFSTSENNCAEIGSTVLTIAAGPLNYVGINPKVECTPPPQPAQ
jgi:hypothetical protein